MWISFAKIDADVAPIIINEKSLEEVSSVKLLGLNIANDLKWNCHMFEVSPKISTKIYVAIKELVTFYVTCLRSITEYACTIFHNSLPNYLSDELVHLQKRAVRIIFPFTSYREALELVNLETLFL